MAELSAMRSELVDRGHAPIVAAIIDQAERDSELRRYKTALFQEGTARLRQLIKAACATGDLRQSCRLDDAVAALAGPIFFRRLCESGTVTSQLIHTVVDDFLTANRAR